MSVGALINLLVLLVFLVVGLAQTGSIDRRLGYRIAIPLAGITFVLAVVRAFRSRRK